MNTTTIRVSTIEHTQGTNKFKTQTSTQPQQQSIKMMIHDFMRELIVAIAPVVQTITYLVVLIGGAMLALWGIVSLWLWLWS